MKLPATGIGGLAVALVATAAVTAAIVVPIVLTQNQSTDSEPDESATTEPATRPEPPPPPVAEPAVPVAEPASAGDSSTASDEIRPAVEAQKAHRVTAGGVHSCALRADGTVTCWGYNYHGQLAAPTSGDFAAVAAGGAHSCALRADGTITCWGDNDFGQYDDIPAGGDFVAVVAGGAHSCALRADSTIICWGADDDGQLDVPTGGGFAAVTAGGAHSCALRADGTITCWGDNSFGQYDDIPAGGGFAAVTAGGVHSCALRVNGTVTCWGADDDGQLDVPTGGDFAAVAAGGVHSCALRADGTITCWGDNSFGQYDEIPAGGDFAAVTAGGVHSCALRADGTVACWGADGEGPMNYDEGPVKFGFLAALSDDHFDWGRPRQVGAETAIGVINAAGGVLGREAELVVENSFSTVEGAVTGYNRIREEIHALGGVESEGAVALLNTVAEDEMPTMCPACGMTVPDTEGGSYIWRITASDTSYGIISAELVSSLGYSWVAMLVQQTEGTESPAVVFKDVWENKLGGKITADVRFQPGLDNYRTEIKQAMSGDPEAVYIGAGPRAGIPIIREYIARGYTATILVPPDLLVPDVAEAAAELPTGRILGARVTDDFDSPAYGHFAAAHRQHAGAGPPRGFYETNEFDQYIILALAMTAAGTTDGAAVAAQVPGIVNAPGTKVYTYADGVAALERGEEIDYDGPSSSLELDATGNLVSPKFAVMHIVDGGYVTREVIEIELDASLSR